MSETTEKAPKTNGNGAGAVLATDDETALALALYRSIPKSDRKEALIDAQMGSLGRQAFAFLADGYKKLTGKDLSDIIILDAESGMFGDPEEMDDEDFLCSTDEDEDEDEDEEEEDEEEAEVKYTATQARRLLIKWMKVNEKSQAFVAGKLGVTQPCVSTWAQKTSLPRERTIPRIVRLCSK